MARTEPVGSQSGGDSLEREGVPGNGGSWTLDLGAIDVRLNEIESEEPQGPGKAGSASNQEPSLAVPELGNGPRELLSESTDLDALMAAILGEDARERARVPDERVPLERVAQGAPVDHPDPEPDAALPWRQELDTLLAEQPPREVANPTANPIATPGPPFPPLGITARSSALMHLSAMVRRWPLSRVSLLSVSALAGMTLGVLAWQSGKSEPLNVSTPPHAVPASPEATPMTVPVPGDQSTVDAATRSTAGEDDAQGRSAGPPRVPGATSGNNARGRTAPAPADARDVAPAPSRMTAANTLKRPVEPAPESETARGLEPPSGRIEAINPSQPTASTASSVTESTTPLTLGAASAAIPATVGGAASGGARPELPAVAPSVVVQRTEPRLLRRAVPEYPIYLRRAKVGGVVTVAMTVDAQGRVASVRSISGPNVLRPAAEAAARRWRYEPATMNGTPLESTVNVTFTFDPSDASGTSR